MKRIRRIRTFAWCDSFARCALADLAVLKRWSEGGRFHEASKNNGWSCNVTERGILQGMGAAAANHINGDEAGTFKVL